MPKPYQFCSDCGSPDLETMNSREFRCVRCGFRHFITPIPAAVAMILDAQERLLIIRRGHQPGLGLLGMPGGVIEPEESGELLCLAEQPLPLPGLRLADDRSLLRGTHREF